MPAATTAVALGRRFPFRHREARAWAMARSCRIRPTINSKSGLARTDSAAKPSNSDCSGGNSRCKTLLNPRPTAAPSSPSLTCRGKAPTEQRTMPKVPADSSPALTNSGRAARYSRAPLRMPTTRRTGW